MRLLLTSTVSLPVGSLRGAPICDSLLCDRRCAGKTFHPNHPSNWDEPTSWSQDMPYYDYSYFIQPNTSTSAYPNGSKQPCPGAGLPQKGAGPSNIDVWCRVDEPHEHFYDFGLANATVGRIKYANNVLKTRGTPFFIQAGFARPHAPWRVPADFWDLYTTEEIAMPLHRLPPENMPGIAWKQNGFYRAADPTQIILPQITCADVVYLNPIL